VADFIMSLDNVIAIAAAAQGSHADHQVGLVAFGLIVSVPIIVWGSTLVLKLIDRYPIVVTFGAGLLGWIAGGMIVTDVALTKHWAVSRPITLAAEVVGALLVVILGRWLAARKTALAPASEATDSVQGKP